MILQNGYAGAPIDRVISALEEQGREVRKNGNGYRSSCPAHDGKNPNLAIVADNTGKVAFTCHSGNCKAESICQAIGLEMRDLFPPCDSLQATQRPAKKKKKTAEIVEPRKVVAEYDYKDEGGEVLFQVVRTEWTERDEGGNVEQKKTFRQRQPSGVPNVKGVRVVPYRLPEFMAELERPVFVVEGEKDVDALAAMGLLATCNACGAKKWTPQHASFLNNRDVYILPDFDDAGQEHGQLVARSLKGIAKSIKVIELPGLDEKGDVSDWIAAGGTGEQLRELVKDASEWDSEKAVKPGRKAVVVCAADVVPEQVDWLWHGWIPRGMMSILDGDPGLGKSTLTIDIAARVTRGYPMPPATPFNAQFEPRDVVFVMSEDSISQTMVPRLIAAGADMKLVHIIKSIDNRGEDEAVDLSQHVELIADEVRKTNAVLVVIDPFDAFVGDTNTHKNSEVRRMLNPVNEMCKETGAAVLFIRHLNKKEGANAINRGGGSGGILAAMRVGMIIARDPEDDETFVLAQSKNNLTKEEKAIRYTITGATWGEDGKTSKIVWGDRCSYSANELVNPAKQKTSKADECADWLERHLHGHKAKMSELKASAKGQDFGVKALSTACTSLGVIRSKDGFGGDVWVSLPGGVVDDGLEF